MTEKFGGRYFVMRRGYPPDAVLADLRVLSSHVFFEMWRRAMNPFHTLEEGDTLYLHSPERKMLVAELRARSVIRTRYESLEEADAKLARVFGMVRPEDGWEDYSPTEGPGHLLAYALEVVAPLSIPFPVSWPKLGGRHGYISLSTFAASEHVDESVRRQVLQEVPSPGGEPLAPALPYATAALDDPSARWRAPRYPKPEVKLEVLERAGGMCENGCGRTGDQFDHIVPWSRGGSSELANIQLLCADCNRDKSDTMPDNPSPEQFWVLWSPVSDLPALRIGETPEAHSVRTVNSVYRLVVDGDVAYAWKRGTRTVFCASLADTNVRRLLRGTSPRMKFGHSDGTSFLHTSNVEEIRPMDPVACLAEVNSGIGETVPFLY
jgi:hypothetical protein